ncbi:hypothetical protein [Chryseobacterium sp. c4a]|uniref:hypothetical protein n=1 Tax=Chryseobacterium sp. c4a TaxID=1573582 RepID=UPI001357C133|nr:hypothetical protein [Chryseobacterium sp. c4a]
MYLIILILFLVPYIVSYFLYKRRINWYKIGVALSFLFWITSIIAVTLADKFITDIDLSFIFYYIWMFWFYLGLLGVCAVFWLYTIIKK